MKDGAPLAHMVLMVIERELWYGGGTTWWYGIMVSLIVPNDDKPRKVFCLELPFLHGYAGMVPWYGTTIP